MCYQMCHNPAVARYEYEPSASEAQLPRPIDESSTPIAKSSLPTTASTRSGNNNSYHRMLPMPTELLTMKEPNYLLNNHAY